MKNLFVELKLLFHSVKLNTIICTTKTHEGLIYMQSTKPNTKQSGGRHACLGFKHTQKQRWNIDSIAFEEHCKFQNAQRVFLWPQHIPHVPKISTKSNTLKTRRCSFVKPVIINHGERWRVEHESYHVCLKNQRANQKHPLTREKHKDLRMF